MEILPLARVDPGDGLLNHFEGPVPGRAVNSNQERNQRLWADLTPLLIEKKKRKKEKVGWRGRLGKPTNNSNYRSSSFDGPQRQTKL